MRTICIAINKIKCITVAKKRCMRTAKVSLLMMANYQHEKYRP